MGGQRLKLDTGRQATTRSLLYFFWWLLALSNHEPGAAHSTDAMRPAGWTGNYWGPAATRARAAGQLPPLPMTPAMARWRNWGRDVLRDGDIVFRMGDSRTLRGIYPLSLFIAKATRSPFSHTAVVAVEDGWPVVYDSSSFGVQRQPFEVWMVDCVGSMGVKRLRPELRRHIPGVLAYCRDVYQRQVPFDFTFHPDDRALYCLELTEKAFRSQGLALSEPVRIGDWERLASYPLTAFAIQYGTGYVLDRPISLEQLVYVPGNESQGVWASPLLETVFGPEPRCPWADAGGQTSGISLKGDLELLILVFGELHRSYAELPGRWLHDRLLPLVRRTLGPLLSTPATGPTATAARPRS